ncbi:acylase [Mastigocoleus testarum]|uniref:7-beta-(4-carbaxybutanamido)cephalosporanic acid acylase n=1 Tax=Mastigocoleus testarum BC008 TaxID=371196 RepID=A0A0V7ZMU1_9CYAN|nr:acylase [Mastigocoleus testarum]KST66005.1 7-beta-(4-carbaxybutanamido)cephalosporanic acid acylase [Mastigocoleus testarum BC008]
MLRKRNRNRILSCVLSLLLVLILGSQTLGSPAQNTEILWDTYGIPHIYGKDTTGAFRAFGWAQMQSHGNLLLRLYGQARGRAAEYWGEEYIDSDRWVLTMGVPERARSWYEAQNSSFRSYLDAFAEGINTYAKENPDAIDDEVEVVLPVKGEDILSHLQRVLNFSFVVSPQRVAGISTPESKAGSNGWAIAPKRSASGNAMLLANPHLPWSDFYLWYEAQITAPGIDAYGASLVGIPVLTIAFNENLGWTHTVNTYDGWDAYQLELVDDGYRFDDKVRPFETKNISLKVRQKDGTLREEPLIVKSSVHGPVVSEKEGQATALRVVGLEQPGVLEQWWDMARSQNLAAFEKALQRLQLPMFTVMYADREGHIMHLFNGQVPVREQGDFQYWRGIIPGNTSKTLWTKIHPYQDLPRVIDPPSGWLQNANDPPWTTTFPVAIESDKYPSYMAPRFMDFRAQSSARMLDEDEKITLDEMIEYKHSTRMEFADRILDDLIPAARKYGGELAQRAATILEKWDRQANTDSRGAVLFAAWAQELDLDKAFSQPWSEDSPRNTPDGLANPQDAVKLLETVAQKVEKAYGKLDVAWGEVFRLKYGNVDLPGNGGDGDLGIFRVINFAPSEDGKFQPVAGDSYVAAIEFSKPVKAMAVMSYGNASQPDSTHQTDQLELVAKKQLRPVWHIREDVEAHLESRQVFSRMGK